MKKHTKIRLGAAALSVIVTTALIAGISYAYNGSFQKNGFHFVPRNHKAIISAIETGDYNIWREAVGDRPITEKITEENFSKFVEMHNLIEEGNFEEARAIGEELGVKGPKGKDMRGDCIGKGNFMKNHEAAREAMDAGDYMAWLEAVEGSPIAEKISEENFSKLVEAHNLMQAGDFEGAREIREELGLKTGRGFGARGMMHGSLK